MGRPRAELPTAAVRRLCWTTTPEVVLHPQSSSTSLHVRTLQFGWDASAGFEEAIASSALQGEDKTIKTNPLQDVTGEIESIHG